MAGLGHPHPVVAALLLAGGVRRRGRSRPHATVDLHVPDRSRVLDRGQGCALRQPSGRWSRRNCSSSATARRRSAGPTPRTGCRGVRLGLLPRLLQLAAGVLGVLGDQLVEVERVAAAIDGRSPTGSDSSPTRASASTRARLPAGNGMVAGIVVVGDLGPQPQRGTPRSSHPTPRRPVPRPGSRARPAGTWRRPARRSTPCRRCGCPGAGAGRTGKRRGPRTCARRSRGPGSPPRR